MNTKYYLIVNENDRGIPEKIGDKQRFIDITEIDLITEQYSREEMLKFLGYEKEKHAKLDIYIMRVRISNNKYDVKFYECIFKESIIDLTPLQKCRLEKIRNLEVNKRKDKIQIGDAPEFKKIVTQLIKNITSDRDQILSRIVWKESILGPRLHEIFLKIYKDNTIRSVNHFSNELFQICGQYKKLRGLFVEYLIAKRLKENMPIPHKSNREISLYDSVCFDYNESFFLSIYNANNDPHNSFYLEYMDQISQKETFSMEEATILSNLRRTPFDNERIGQLFIKGGIEEVMKYVDTEELYNSSLGDLTKMGIYTERYYLDHMKNNKKRY